MIFDTITNMKLRIKGDSLRLRLTRNEVDRLASEGIVEESIGFGASPHQSLIYRVRRDGSSSSIDAECADNELTVSVPTEITAQWIGTEEVGMEAHSDIGNGRFLHILIEKDFACLTPRPGDDDNDTFPHPAADRI